MANRILKMLGLTKNLENTYTQENLETAAALWEAVLMIERLDQTSASLLSSQRIDRTVSWQIHNTRSSIGGAEMRRFVVSLTGPVEEAWKIAHQEREKYPASSSIALDDLGSFDWDFIPRWITHNVDWTNPYAPRIK